MVSFNTFLWYFLWVMEDKHTQDHSYICIPWVLLCSRCGESGAVEKNLRSPVRSLYPENVFTYLTYLPEESECDDGDV